MFRPKAQMQALSGRKNLLGDKDRKNLRKDFLAQFPKKTREEFETLFPSSCAAEVLLVREPPTTCVVQLYLADNVPMLITCKAKKKSSVILPTLPALHILPDLIPLFVCPSVVSKFILRGADLMLPGCMVPADGGFTGMDMKPDQPWGVRVYGNPLPVAVGLSLMTGTEADKSEKGRVMELVHFYGDLVCSFGAGVASETENLLTNAPDGFTVTQVFPAGSQAAKIGEDKLPDEWVARLDKFEKTGHELQAPAEAGGGGGGEEQSHPIAEEKVEDATERAALAEQPGAEEEESRLPSSSVVPGQPSEAPPPVVAAAEPPASAENSKVRSGSDVPAAAPRPLPPLVADAVMEFCLCESLRSQVNLANLPFDSSAIYSTMLRVLDSISQSPQLLEYLASKGMEPTEGDVSEGGDAGEGGDEKPWSRADLRGAELKQTKHKTFKNFIRTYTKANVFTVKEVRESTVVVKVNLNHPLLKGHNPVLAAQTSGGAGSSGKAPGKKAGTAKKDEKAAAADPVVAPPSGGGGSPSKKSGLSGESTSKHVRLISLHRPLTEAKLIFDVGTAGTDLEKNELFERAEVCRVLDAYFASLEAGTLPEIQKRAATEFPTLPGQAAVKKAPPEDAWDTDSSGEEEEAAAAQKIKVADVAMVPAENSNKEAEEASSFKGLSRSEMAKRDPLLRSFLLSKAQRKEWKETKSVVNYNATNDEIANMFLTRALKLVTVVCPANTTVREVLSNPKKFKFVETDEPPKIIVSVHKARGHVKTKISGIHHFSSIMDPKQLAEQLKKTCAASATVKEVDELKGLKKPLGVEVQGDVSQAVVTVLQKQYGLPREMIQTSSSSS